MQTINQHIKTKSFSNVYLIFGEEIYLCNQAKQKLKQAIVSSDDTMNYSYFEGKKINVSEVVDLAMTAPFFNDRRLLLLEETGFFKQCPDGLLELISTLPPTTCLIFSETEVDKRSKLYKAIQKYGYVGEMKTPDEKALFLWISSLLKQEKKLMKERTFHYFIERTGTDMEHIKQELEKLFSYTLSKDEITIEDIEAITTQITTSKIFDMLDAMMKHEQEKAMNYYYDLLALKEPPMRILALIVRQINLMIQIKEMNQKSIFKGDIAKQVGVPSFAVSKYLDQSRNYTISNLKQMLHLCIDTETSVKTGTLTDTIGIELLIVTFCSPSSLS